MSSSRASFWRNPELGKNVFSNTALRTRSCSFVARRRVVAEPLESAPTNVMLTGLVDGCPEVDEDGEEGEDEWLRLEVDGKDEKPKFGDDGAE